MASLAVSLLVSTLSGCGGSGDDGGDPSTDKLAQIVARGTLIGFFEPDYAPQSLAVAGAVRPDRHEVQRRAADGRRGHGLRHRDRRSSSPQELGVEPCFVSPPWTEVTSGNWGDRWDIAYGSGAITADRMERLYMTQPYYATANRYFVQKDSAFQRPSDLDGKKIGACVSCSQEAYLQGRAGAPGHRCRRRRRRARRSSSSRSRAQASPQLEKGTVDAFLAADPVGQAHHRGGRGVAAARGRRVQRVSIGFRG